MNLIDKICIRVDDAEILDMLQEECAELIQAVSKCKRVMRGDKSVDPRKARESLVEEIGDVQNMTVLAMRKVLTLEESSAAYTGRKAKIKRYYKRIQERDKDAAMDD